MTCQLLDSRRLAALALSLAAVLASLHLRLIWLRLPPRPHWIDDFNAILPHLTAIAVQVLAFAALLLFFTQALRELRGSERLYIVTLLAEGLIEPFRFFLSAPAGTVAVYLQLTADALLLATAAHLLLTTHAAPRPTQSPQPHPH